MAEPAAISAPDPAAGAEPARRLEEFRRRFRSDRRRPRHSQRARLSRLSATTAPGNRRWSRSSPAPIRQAPARSRSKGSRSRFRARSTPCASALRPSSRISRSARTSTSSPISFSAANSIRFGLTKSPWRFAPGPCSANSRPAFRACASRWPRFLAVSARPWRSRVRC